MVRTSKDRDLPRSHTGVPSALTEIFCRDACERAGQGMQGQMQTPAMGNMGMMKTNVGVKWTPTLEAMVRKGLQFR